ncbi:MAG: Rpn family recombination-promoting nuclease/putative transposase [Clostridiales bacterium]|nr:Rpn family recombination-promoting nuclease/putative transposase [Clostridiales bacterium]
MEQRKQLNKLTLLDRFLFAEAMEDPENMQAVLEIILGKDVVLNQLPQTEKEQRASSRFRTVRLDVWAQDSGGSVYDVEAQQRNTGNLPKRSRFYQALIDRQLMEPGDADFNKLNPVFIIIISPFDLFGEKKFVYTFSMQCRESPGLELHDEVVRIFLNTHGKNDHEVSDELRELLYYMEHTNDKDQPVKSLRVQKLAQNVTDIQNNAEVGVRYMQAWEERVIELQEARKDERRIVESEMMGLVETSKQKAEAAEQKVEAVMQEAESKLLSQIRHHMGKGYSVDQMAENLLESPDRIRELMMQIRKTDH